MIGITQNYILPRTQVTFGSFIKVFENLLTDPLSSAACVTGIGSMKTRVTS